VRWLNWYWIESPIMTDTRHHRRADFKAIRAVPTRWMDNDQYVHVNNVTYYSAVPAFEIVCESS
jgi:acyl-ACP thioesterase